MAMLQMTVTITESHIFRTCSGMWIATEVSCTHAGACGNVRNRGQLFCVQSSAVHTFLPNCALNVGLICVSDQFQDPHLVELVRSSSHRCHLCAVDLVARTATSSPRTPLASVHCAFVFDVAPSHLHFVLCSALILNGTHAMLLL